MHRVTTLSPVDDKNLQGEWCQMWHDMSIATYNFEFEKFIKVVIYKLMKSEMDRKKKIIIF